MTPHPAKARKYLDSAGTADSETPENGIAARALLVLVSAPASDVNAAIADVLKLLCAHLHSPSVRLFRVGPQTSPLLLCQFPETGSSADMVQCHSDVATLAVTGGELAETEFCLAIANAEDRPLVLTWERSDAPLNAGVAEDLRLVLTGLSTVLARSQTAPTLQSADLVAATEALDQGLAIYDAQGGMIYSNQTYRQFFQDYQSEQASFPSMRALIDFSGQADRVEIGTVLSGHAGIRSDRG